MTSKNNGFGKHAGAAAVRRVPRTVKAGEDAPASQSRSEGTTLNAGIIATIAGLLIASGAGAFMLFEAFSSVSEPGSEADGRATSYVSSVDDFCREGWRKDQSNVDQMHCYMTSSTKRLCDPAERAHLVATIKLFERDYGVWKRRHNAAALGTIGKVQMQGPAIGVATSRMTRAMQDPNATDEERAARTDKVMEMMEDVMSGPNAVMAENHNMTPFYQLEDDIKELAADGLISEADFGYNRPAWVDRGLKAATQVRSVCAK